MMPKKKPKNRERRPKGSGTLQWVGDRVRGRKRINGRDEYTILFADPEEAEKALKKLGRTDQAKPAKMPTFGNYLLELILPPDEDLPKEERRPDLDHAWRARYLSEYEEPTWALHESRYRLWIATSKLAKMPINEIKRRDVKDFIWGLRGKMAGHSLRRLGSVVHTAFENALTLDELIEFNPAHKLPYPSIPETVVQILTDKQVSAIYDNAVKLKWPRNAKQFARMLLVSVDTGIRPGEICALPKTVFDREAGTITIAVSAKRRKGGIEAGGTKTENVRVVDLSSDAMTALLDELRENPNPGSFIFARKDGQAYRPDTYGGQFRKFRAVNGLEGSKLKDLRKTAVTLFCEEGDLKAAQKLVGHKKSGVTADVYQQSRRERQTAAVRNVEKRIGRRFKDSDEKLA